MTENRDLPARETDSITLYKRHLIYFKVKKKNISFHYKIDGPKNLHNKVSSLIILMYMFSKLYGNTATPHVTLILM